MVNVVRWVRNKISSFDMFEKPIMFTYKGHPSFKTLGGGLATIIVVTIMSIFTYIVMKELIFDNNITANKNTLFKNLFNDHTIHNFGKSGVRIAFTINNSTVPLDSKYYEFKAIHFRHPKGKEDVPYIAKEVIPLEIVNGNETDFYDLLQIETRNDLGHALGIRNTSELFVYGVALGKYTSSISFELDTGKDKAEGAIFSDSVQAIQAAFIQIYILNPYFDFNDKDNPIKYYLDSKLKLYTYQVGIVTTMYIRENRYVLNDNLFFQTQGQSGTFFSVSEYSTIYSHRINSPFFMEIVADDQIDEYERTVTTILDATGTIGGIFELLDVVF